MHGSTVRSKQEKEIVLELYGFYCELTYMKIDEIMLSFEQVPKMYALLNGLTKSIDLNFFNSS